MILCVCGCLYFNIVIGFWWMVVIDMSRRDVFMCVKGIFGKVVIGILVVSMVVFMVKVDILVDVMVGVYSYLGLLD